MFGTKLRTWMEAHIVRPKKKKDRKKGEKGFDSNCNSPGSQSNNRSPGLHQVHPLNSPVKNVDNIILSNGSTTYVGGTTNSSSETSGGTGSVNLSSPESAYSTGYSTDGTSPGASFPPEYYINIRTGTHYFQSNKGGRTKRPNESGVFNVPGNEKQLDECIEIKTNSNINMTRENKLIREVKSNTPFKGTEVVANHRIQQQCQLNLQTHQRESPQHRRTDSYSASDVTMRNSLPVPSSIPPPLVSSPLVQSPRQRSRIRTNPWLSANSSGSSTTTGGAGSGGNGGYKSHITLDESSSSSGLKLTESSGSTSDVNFNNHRNGLGRRDCRQESLSVGRSPINQNWRISPGMEAKSKLSHALIRRSSSSSSTSSLTHSIRSSEDDITLNEMMGKFDESYVYEKETDILSDSDPTDCEDYVNNSPSDVDTGQDGGDENDPFENDDFDYIDNGSLLDLDNLDVHLPNTGHCTYFTFTSELSRRSSKIRESLLRKRSKDEIHRNSSSRSNSKRQSQRHKKLEDKPSERRKKRQSQRKKAILDKCDEVTANINRVLVERMLLKNSGFNQGSRSVGGTPICLRRRRHHDINENLSPLRQNEDYQSFVQPSVTDNNVVKRRSNSVSYVNGNMLRQQISRNSYMTTFASEIALIEADKEADKKYRELILEAENILVNMKNTTTTTTTTTNTTSPAVPSPRRIHNGLANKRVELIKNTELNIELALSKSRNSQPELQSGSIRDLEHTSPKRQFNQPCSPVHRFMERNSGNAIKENYHYRPEKSADSPVMTRRMLQNSPCRNLMQNRMMMIEQEVRDRSRSRGIEINNIRSFSQDSRVESTYSREQPYPLVQNSTSISRKDPLRQTKEDFPTSSSSDSDDRCDSKKRTPLMTFRSVDMGPIKESTYYCPQSEPVKRKVYAGSATYGRIQKTLGERHVVLRNSDGDTATDDTDDSRRTLREKIVQLRQERMIADANLSAQDSQLFQHHLTQLRRQMLMHTIEGLKRSLEDQSATLKQTCLQDTILHDELP
ncbi:uncharacterized protein [Chelonus insularis]|uniref:uncharacterized protein isoform X2 n=1 Tax=Chelonus insularis TaxID=460826 RepID=UPI00158EEC20|nr:uncharacterized protein LOC118066516 isoform X2 [Chelonus insularis]